MFFSQQLSNLFLVYDMQSVGCNLLQDLSDGIRWSSAIQALFVLRFNRCFGCRIETRGNNNRFWELYQGENPRYQG